MHNSSTQGRYSKKKKRIRWTKFLPILLLLLAAEFGILALHEKSGLDKSQKKFEALSQQVHSAPTPIPSGEIGANPSDPTHPSVSGASDPLPGSQYLALAAANPDFYGWLQIDGTTIDYPVMFTPDDPEKYLHLDFDGHRSTTGTPFLDERSTPDSDNFIIYAHNMNNGTMFKDLLNYEDKSYWEAHPIIHFNTPYAQNDYEIMSVFYDRVYYQYETAFRYYDFIHAASDADYDAAVQKYLEKSLYDTGVTAKSGDQLLTLSTCSYHEKDGRFVVVARKISQQ